MAIKVGTFQKTNWETWIPAVNFAKDLEKDGGSIDLSNSSITATDKNGTDVTSDVLDQANKAVNDTLLQIRVKNGLETGSLYDLLFRAVTTLENKYEAVIKMKIKE